MFLFYGKYKFALLKPAFIDVHGLCMTGSPELTFIIIIIMIIIIIIILTSFVETG